MNTQPFSSINRTERSAAGKSIRAGAFDMHKGKVNIQQAILELLANGSATKQTIFDCLPQFYRYDLNTTLNKLLDANKIEANRTRNTHFFSLKRAEQRRGVALRAVGQRGSRIDDYFAKLEGVWEAATDSEEPLGHRKNLEFR